MLFDGLFLTVYNVIRENYNLTYFRKLMKYRSMSRRIKENNSMTNLDRILSHIKHKHVYIQTHNFPDPDAIASAFGLQELLKYCGIESTICYKGTIVKVRKKLYNARGKKYR